MENKFFVGARADHIVIMRPPVGDLSKADALNLAAWIAALCDKDEFEKAYAEVINT